jgi:hypothetical protein
LLKRTKSSSVQTIDKEPAGAAAVQQTEHVPLNDRLRDIRSEALRGSAGISDTISRLHAQREQLEEMCAEINATIAFLRAQRKGK